MTVQWFRITPPYIPSRSQRVPNENSADDHDLELVVALLTLALSSGGTRNYSRLAQPVRTVA